MKARIKKTGEIVDVYHESQHGTPKMIYKESVLVNSRMWTEDELELLNEEYDHWQDVRERAAIAVMQTLIAKLYDTKSNYLFSHNVAVCSVEYADELVKRLKGE
jgi:fibrillarin-like rRNA methylase